MTQGEIREKVWTWLVAHFLCLRPHPRVDPDGSLHGNGVFDAIRLTELIGFIEGTFGIAIEQEEVREAHFGTINVNSPCIQAKPSNA